MVGRLGSPLRQRQAVQRLLPLMGSQEQVGVTGDEQRREGGHGRFGSHLGFANAEQGFFLTEVDLILPSPQIDLQGGLRLRCGSEHSR